MTNEPHYFVGWCRTLLASAACFVEDNKGSLSSILSFHQMKHQFWYVRQSSRPVKAKMVRLTMFYTFWHAWISILKFFHSTIFYMKLPANVNFHSEFNRPYPNERYYKSEPWSTFRQEEREGVQVADERLNHQCRTKPTRAWRTNSGKRDTSTSLMHRHRYVVDLSMATYVQLAFMRFSEQNTRLE